MAERILIAEDEESIVTSLEFLMKGCGYETRTVQDGAQAIRAASEFDPHLVLLDVMLPMVNGLDVCRALRQDPRRQGLRILMLTAKGGTLEVARGMEAGADDYMMKPFSTHQLVERVRSLLGGDGRIVRDTPAP